MPRTLADRADRRPCLLIVGGRRRDDLLFRDDLRALRERLDPRIVEVLRDPRTTGEARPG
jgi:NAD(P)H-flavin reductase